MKRLILLIICTLFLSACTAVEEPAIESESNEKKVEVIEVDASLEGHSKLLLDNILSGGPPPDGIPPIDDPKFISVEEASKWMHDDDMVFILELNSLVYVFPQRIMVWHEIVNMTDLKANCSLTYCPLTGSVIAYRYPDGDGISFGTSGNLINSNLLMYERSSGTLISQIDGIGLDKDLYGIELETKPSFWVRWGKAKETFTNAKVLSDDTGSLRDYTSDPYGSYKDVDGSNYYFNEGLIFPPIHSDENDVFPSKKSIIGLKLREKKYAIDKEHIEKDGLVVYENLNLFAVYDESISNVRLYMKPDGGELSYKDGVISSSSDMTWSINGRSLDELDDLIAPTYYEVMWFAWYAFYPDTEIIK